MNDKLKPCRFCEIKEINKLRDKLQKLSNDK